MDAKSIFTRAKRINTLTEIVCNIITTTHSSVINGGRRSLSSSRLLIRRSDDVFLNAFFSNEKKIVRIQFQIDRKVFVYDQSTTYDLKRFQSAVLSFRTRQRTRPPGRMENLYDYKYRFVFVDSVLLLFIACPRRRWKTANNPSCRKVKIDLRFFNSPLYPLAPTSSSVLVVPDRTRIR